jgi:hypothetical protein
LPWRKPRWFDQRYEFGHWGGHIESARTQRSGARSSRRPIRGRSARPRGVARQDSHLYLDIYLMT